MRYNISFEDGPLHTQYITRKFNKFSLKVIFFFYLEHLDPPPHPLTYSSSPRLIDPPEARGPPASGQVMQPKYFNQGHPTIIFTFQMCVNIKCADSYQELSPGLASAFHL